MYMNKFIILLIQFFYCHSIVESDKPRMYKNTELYISAINKLICEPIYDQGILFNKKHTKKNVYTGVNLDQFEDSVIYVYYTKVDLPCHIIDSLKSTTDTAFSTPKLVLIHEYFDTIYVDALWRIRMKGKYFVKSLDFSKFISIQMTDETEFIKNSWYFVSKPR